MTDAALDAILVGRDAALSVGATLRADEADLPSDCAGWSVKDVFIHLWLSYEQILAPDSMPPAYPDDMEASLDVFVAAKREVPWPTVLERYEAASERCLVLLSKFQRPNIRDTQVTMQNLGTYPLHLLADANAFDHYAHLRLDVLAPFGPIERTIPPASEVELGPTLGWMTTGLPQMCATALAGIDGTVGLTLTGPGGGRWLFDNGDLVRCDDPADAEVRSSGTDFVSWGTRRRPWRSFDVSMTGDVALGERFCDAVNVI